MKNKRGISLIVLVITIIVMIILASAIIISLSGNGVIFKTNKAKFQNDMATMKEELSVYISDRELETNGAYNHELLNADKSSLVEEGTTVEEKTILDIIKSMDNKYIDKIEIVNGKLIYTGSDTNEIKWSDEILEGIRGYELKEQNIEVANTLKLSDSINMSLSNYRIYGNSVTQQLPEEYQEVGYIEATGTQYIDTGFVGKSGIRTLVKFMFENYNQTEATYLLGSYTNTSTPNRVYAPYIADNDRVAVGLGNYYISDYVIDKDKIYEVETQLLSNKINCSINGENIISEVGNFNVNGEGTLYLFSRNLPTQYSLDNFIGRIYSCKIWDNDVLMRDFIPCYRKSDGEIGMYDIVNDVFYTNQGTGEFLKGNDIGSVGDYVVDMNFDNEWKQGAAYGGDSYYNIRVICKNFVKSEAGTKYKVTSNLPDNIQFSLVNGTFTTSPATQALTAYDSGWQDDDFTFTSTVDGNILLTIRYKDNSNITPKDVAKYEIKVEKYANETEEGGQYVIPIKASGINLIDITKYNNVTTKTINGVTFTPLGDERVHITGKTIDTSIRTLYEPSMNTSRPIKAGVYKARSNNNIWQRGITIMFGIYDSSDNWIVNINAMHSTVVVPRDGYIKYIHLSVYPGITTEFDEIIELQLTKGVDNYDYEPYVEPREYNIYLDEPLRKVGDYVDYIDFRSQEVVRNVEVVESTSGEQTLRGLDTPAREKITIPSIMLNEGTNIIEVLTKAQPSKMEALYYKK